MRLLLLILVLMSALPRPAVAVEEGLIAVATNFLSTARALEPMFEVETGLRVRFASGSTGKLAAQIMNGAPFHAFLAADTERPDMLEAEGRIVPGSRFTYASGRLALYSADPAQIAEDGAETLRDGRFERLAIANPALAPYGAAAAETIEGLGLTEALRPKLVMGENVGQAQAIVATGNAELGFVALAGVINPARGSIWPVPEESHSPLRQDAVLLKRAPDRGAAMAFLEYLKSPQARALIASRGYKVP